MLFMSYASEDRDWVSTLATDVAQFGVETWVDRQNLLGGDQWRDEVVKAIRSCSAMVVVLSESAVASREVAREAEVADASGKRIIPVIKEACNPQGMALILSGRHWIDFSTGDYAGGLRQLEAALGGRDDGQVRSRMSSQPAIHQIVGAWQVWIQHQFLPGFGNFEFKPDHSFVGLQSQPRGTVEIEGRWTFDASTITVQGVARPHHAHAVTKVIGRLLAPKAMGPYNLMLHIAEVGDGYFNARSHDGFQVVFQWAGG